MLITSAPLWTPKFPPPRVAVHDVGPESLWAPLLSSKSSSHGTSPVVGEEAGPLVGDVGGLPVGAGVGLSVGDVMGLLVGEEVGLLVGDV